MSTMRHAPITTNEVPRGGSYDAPLGYDASDSIAPKSRLTLTTVICPCGRCGVGLTVPAPAG